MDENCVIRGGKAAFIVTESNKVSAGRQQCARVLAHTRLNRVDRRPMECFGTHRSRWREEEALSEADVVVEQIDHRRFGLYPLSNQVDTGTRQEISEIFRINVAVCGGNLVEEQFGRHLQEAE